MPGRPGYQRRRTSQTLAVRARELRREQTEAEALLWQHLRGRGLEGHKFRRQHAVGRFIVDFCCPERRLVVEIDGPVHEAQVERDAERAELLKIQGYTVVRFTNAQVISQLDVTLATLRQLLADEPG